MNKEIKGGVLIGLSTLGSGSMAILAKLAYAEGANVITVLLIRFCLAILLLAAICLVTRTTLMLSKRKLTAFLCMGFFGYGTMAYLFFNSLNYLSASVVAIILYSYPAIVFLICLLKRQEEFDKWKLFSLLLSLSGVLLVIGGSLTGLNPRGVCYVLGAALLYAVYIVISKEYMEGTSPLAATTYLTGGALLFNLIWLVLSGNITWPVPLVGWFAIGSIALFSTVLAFIFFLAGLKYVGSSVAAIISTIEPIITIALAKIIFGEALTLKQLLGAIIILSGVLILQLSQQSKGGRKKQGAVAH